jgi:hypothetical protein
MRRLFPSFTILVILTIGFLFDRANVVVGEGKLAGSWQTSHAGLTSAALSFAKEDRKASLHVAEIRNLSSDKNRPAGSWSARFVVTVEDTIGTLVDGVTVTCDWAGLHAADGTRTEITDAKGRAVFNSSSLPIAGTTTLTVTSLSKAGHDYDDRKNIASSRTASFSVPWTPKVGAEDWLLTALDGHYAKVHSAEGTLIQLATDAAGNPAHAVGDFKFSFPGAIPDGKYRLTVHWRTGTMGGTPWAFRLGAEAGRVTENGISNGQWHYFYPGHSGSHSDQWFAHDMAGSDPIDFAMWPNSPVSTDITIAATDPNTPAPDPAGTPIYVAFDTRIQPKMYPAQPPGFQDTPMVTFGGATHPEGGPGAKHWKAYTAWNKDADPGKETLNFTGSGTTTFDHSLPPGNYIVHAYWSANRWNNGDWVGLRFSGPGVTERGTDDPGGLHRIYPPTTEGEPVRRDEIVGPSMAHGSTKLTAGLQPSHFPTGGAFGGSVFGTHLSLAAGNKVTFTVNENNKHGNGNVFFYGLTFVPAIFPDRQNVTGVGQGDFYIRLRDMSPGRNNSFSIDSFELTPIGETAERTNESARSRLPSDTTKEKRSATTTAAAAPEMGRGLGAPTFPLAPVGEKFTIGVYYAMPWLEPKDNFSWDYAFMDMARSGCNFVVISGNCWANQWAAIKRWGMTGVTSYNQLTAYPGPGKWKPSDSVAGIQEQRERLKSFVWNGEYVGDTVVGHIMDDEPECRGLTEDEKNYLRAWADVYHQHNPAREAYVNHCDPEWYDLNEKHATCSAAPTIAVNSKRITDRIKAARTIGLKNFTVVALLGRMSDWSGNKANMIESWNLGRATPEVFNWLASRTNYQDAYEEMITAYCYGTTGFHPFIYNQHRGYSLVDKDGNDQYGIRKGFSDAAHDLRRSHGWPGVTLSNNGSPFNDRGTYPPGDFTLTAQALSDSGTIKKVLFGKSIDGGSTWETSEDATAPYSATFSTDPETTVIFRARAVATDGKTSLYAANMIHINNEPSP